MNNVSGCLLSQTLTDVKHKINGELEKYIMPSGKPSGKSSPRSCKPKEKKIPTSNINMQSLDAHDQQSTTVNNLESERHQQEEEKSAGKDSKQTKHRIKSKKVKEVEPKDLARYLQKKVYCDNDSSEVQHEGLEVPPPAQSDGTHAVYQFRRQDQNLRVHGARTSRR